MPEIIRNIKQYFRIFVSNGALYYQKKSGIVYCNEFDFKNYSNSFNSWIRSSLHKLIHDIELNQDIATDFKNSCVVYNVYVKITVKMQLENPFSA